jgi:hypothetical protein
MGTRTERTMCSSCLGAGNRMCLACNGTGRVASPSPSLTGHSILGKICPSCNGQGMTRCMSCNGRGYTERIRLDFGFGINRPPFQPPGVNIPPIVPPKINIPPIRPFRTNIPPFQSPKVNIPPYGSTTGFPTEVSDSGSLLGCIVSLGILLAAAYCLLGTSAGRAITEWSANRLFPWATDQFVPWITDQLMPWMRDLFAS